MLDGVSCAGARDPTGELRACPATPALARGHDVQLWHTSICRGDDAALPGYASLSSSPSNSVEVVVAVVLWFVQPMFMIGSGVGQGDQQWQVPASTVAVAEVATSCI